MTSRLMKLALVAVLALGCSFAGSSFTEEARSQGEVTFTDSVKAGLQAKTAIILARDCAGCHGGAYPKMKLNLESTRFIESVKDVPSRQIDSLKLVDTEKPEKSYLVMKMRGGKGIRGDRMPPDAEALKSEDIKTVELWVHSVAVLEKGATPAAPPEQGKKKALNEGGKNKTSGSGASAFFGTTLINLPTTAALDRGEILFRISHRFFYPTDLGHEFFLGLDGPAFIFMSLGVGITDRVSASLGRTNLYDEIELSSKIALCRQGRDFSLPFSATLAGSFALTTERPVGSKLFDADNMHFSAQLALSRCFTERFSLLCVPSFSSNTKSRMWWEYEHFEKENTTALGLGGRFMFWKNVSLVGEWTPVLSGQETRVETWGVGIEAKKGGHVFHVFATNAYGLTPNQYLPGGDINDHGDFRFGFNIYRIL